MKKGKLNLNKKSVAKLSDKNLENIQGGGKNYTKKICPCTSIQIEEEEMPSVDGDPKKTIIVTCR